MRFATGLIIALTGVLGLDPPIVSAQGQRLKDAILGSYGATGTIWRTPDSPPERIACRLDGKQRSTTELRFSGRCATGSRSGDLVMDLTVKEPGSRYRLRVRIKARNLRSDQSRFEYRGAAQNSAATFTTDFSEGDQRYRSVMILQYSSRGIRTISETVTDLSSGQTSTLLNLEIRRR